MDGCVDQIGLAVLKQVLAPDAESGSKGGFVETTAELRAASPIGIAAAYELPERRHIRLGTGQKRSALTESYTLSLHTILQLTRVARLRQRRSWPQANRRPPSRQRVGRGQAAQGRGGR